MAISENTELTPREFVLMENERDENRLIREHAETMKKLELEMEKEKNQAEIKLAELEARWNSWLKIPLTVITLPVRFLFGIAYICSVLVKKEPSINFWRYIK